MPSGAICSILRPVRRMYGLMTARSSDGVAGASVTILLLLAGGQMLGLSDPVEMVQGVIAERTEIIVDFHEQ